MSNGLSLGETINMIKEQLKDYVLCRNAWYSKNDIEKKLGRDRIFQNKSYD